MSILRLFGNHFMTPLKPLVKVQKVHYKLFTELFGKYCIQKLETQSAGKIVVLQTFVAGNNKIVINL